MSTEQETQVHNPPVETVRVGPIQASIWQNTGTSGNYFTVTFERRYLDDTGQWKGTRGFSKSDLLALARAADKAFDVVGEISKAAKELAAGY